MTHFALKDELLDAQTLRVAGAAPYGGADVGECLRAAAGVRGTDLTSWHTAWTSMAASALSLAESQQAIGPSAQCPARFFPCVKLLPHCGGHAAGSAAGLAPYRELHAADGRFPVRRRLTRATRRRSSRSPMRPRLCPGTSIALTLRDLNERRGRRSSSQAATTVQPKSCTSPTAPPRWLAGTTCSCSTGRVRERR